MLEHQEDDLGSLVRVEANEGDDRECRQLVLRHRFQVALSRWNAKCDYRHDALEVEERVCERSANARGYVEHERDDEQEH